MAVLTRRIESSRGFAVIESGGGALSNSTTETNMFSSVIPAGKMGTDKVLNFSTILHLTTPALSVPSLTLKVKLGSYTMTLVSSGLLSINIADKPVIIEGLIENLGVANSQFVAVKIFNNSGGLLLSSLSSAFAASDGSATVDTTVDQTFSITAQFGGLSGTTSITPKLTQINLT